MSNDQNPERRRPTFYTISEAAELLRVDRTTIYRAIREDAFPAVRVRTRYVVPAAAVEEMATQAIDSGGVVDVAEIAVRRRMEREVAHLLGPGGTTTRGSAAAADRPGWQFPVTPLWCAIRQRTVRRAAD